MPPSDLLLACLAAAAVFAYIPGPAMLYASARTLAGGRRAGLMAAAGIHLGGYVHVFAAALGLAALFHAVPTLYVAMKILGAAYLCWLGIGLLRQGDADMSAPTTTSAGSAQRAFTQSVLVETLNPKTAVFFLAFLPQFTDPAAASPLWGQLLVLGTAVNVMFSSADLFCVYGADAVQARLRRSSGAQRVLRWLGGGTLIGLGVKLVAQRGGPEG
ncbi:amino acid transporter [Rhodovibrio sodomensis]|uniref:Amino acid transporter n=1 Tax=Rhodovibrio sodomensis TaxID=1088 RepID=A0ABS1DFD9_9PROT|nr:amino acid transporter [Rhodovibrio sodomensis]